MTRQQQGLAFGLIGILIFSGSLPATRAAVDGFDPVFLTAARALLATIAACLLLLTGARQRPDRTEIRSLVVVAFCVVLAYPLLSAIALTHMPSARAILFTGLLPIATAAAAILCGGERPRLPFWLFAIAGAGVVGSFALLNGAAARADHVGDWLMLVAILLCGLGYAEGAKLARTLGGIQVICWALLLSSPAMLFVAFWLWPATFSGIEPSAWMGLGYVSLFSMLIGFVFWYRGLALGGTTKVGQLQLLQPLVGFGLSALLLGEAVGWPTLLAALAVLPCVAGARRYA